MLIRFTLENWMSFRDRVTFSMIASRERQHRERVPALKSYRTSVLPMAAIYGGNASGKTNFFKAINFVRDFVVRGTQPDAMIGVEPYRLSRKHAAAPSFFAAEILVEEVIYEYRFSVTRKKVLEEKLTEIRPASEKVLFSRTVDKIEFDAKYEKDEFLRFVFRGTRDNQLFLTNSVFQKVDSFQHIFTWFKNLNLIAPDARFHPFENIFNDNNPLFDKMSEMLSRLDTGITHLGSEKISFDLLPLPAQLKETLKEQVSEDNTVSLIENATSERYLIFRKDGELAAKKLVAYHTTAEGDEVRFNLKQESDGSLRMIDLLPAFLDMSSTKEPHVFIIDEIDRSLHTLLTRQLLETYLAACSPSSRAQLLITTHDVLLMDQDLLRRDEMWVAERDPSGNSSLVPFSDFQDIRYDKNIRKSYLQGRLGGIPKLLIENTPCQDPIESVGG